MKFGLSLPNAGPVARLVEVARLADSNGWDGVFLWDHIHLFRDLRLELHDPWVTLGAIAQVTSNVRLGTMVTPLPRRRPQKFAKEVVTLDHLSNGRVVVGVGLGFPPADEYTMFGEDGDDRARADRLDEALEVVTALWTSQPIEHRGAHYSVSAELHPCPLQRPRPPIWVAAMCPNRRPLHRAARYEGVAPIGADGQPITHDELAQVARAVGSRLDVIASRMSGPTVDEYAAAWATWLSDSRWPADDWLDELHASASRGPR